MTTPMGNCASCDDSERDWIDEDVHEELRELRRQRVEGDDKDVREELREL